jgi:nitrite reductase/ring-hydroxylating ferredoxin subunit
VSEDGGRRVSRRGLFGVFRKGARSLRDGLDDVQRAHRGEPVPYPAAQPEIQYDRLLRPPVDLAVGRASGPAAWIIDLQGRRLRPGEDAVVRGGGLMEPLILVRVHEHHWAACTGECPIDGSDIRWQHVEDLLRCPSCSSAWRLDGECLQGPADSALARFVVDAYEDDEGGTEVRVHAP